jgi:hypothetical protein
MSRIIINARGVSDAAAVDHVLASIQEGKISNNGKQYCYGINRYNVMTTCKLNNSGSFTFWVYPEINNR